MTGGPALGLGPGLTIQEFGWDDDADEPLRASLREPAGSSLVDEDYEDVADAAVVWWRSDDGGIDELTDLLVDAQANLDGDGSIWVLTPKAGRPGAVPAGDVEEAATTAGMHTTSAAAVAPAWSGMRLSSRRR